MYFDILKNYPIDDFLTKTAHMRKSKCWHLINSKIVKEMVSLPCARWYRVVWNPMENHSIIWRLIGRTVRQGSAGDRSVCFKLNMSARYPFSRTYCNKPWDDGQNLRRFGRAANGYSLAWWFPHVFSQIQQNTIQVLIRTYGRLLTGQVHIRLRLGHSE